MLSGIPYRIHSFVLSCPSTNLCDLSPVFGIFDGDVIGHLKVECRACNLHQLADQEKLHVLPSVTSQFSLPSDIFVTADIECGSAFTKCCLILRESLDFPITLI